jgi:hypothetical protein
VIREELSRLFKIEERHRRLLARLLLAPCGGNRTGHGEVLTPPSYKRTRKPPQDNHWGSADAVFVSAASSCGP